MVKRKAMRQSDRFEVFKRDSFTCQYCGESAPKVILNVDHIVPVKEGGDNSITNLVTSCFDCNSGKGARKLDDGAVVSKQMDQLKQLNERKQQIEMIAKWNTELVALEERKLEIVRDAFNRYLELGGKQIATSYLSTDIRGLISKYEIHLVLDSIEKSATQYLRNPKSADDRDKFLSMVPRICYWAHFEAENPEIAQIRKIAYGANRRWSRCDVQSLVRRLIQIREKHEISVELIGEMIREATGVMSFEALVAEHLEGDGNG